MAAPAEVTLGIPLTVKQNFPSNAGLSVALLLRREAWEGGGLDTTKIFLCDQHSVTIPSLRPKQYVAVR